MNEFVVDKIFGQIVVHFHPTIEKQSIPFRHGVEREVKQRQEKVPRRRFVARRGENQRRTVGRARRRQTAIVMRIRTGDVRQKRSGGTRKPNPIETKTGRMTTFAYENRSA